MSGAGGYAFSSGLRLEGEFGYRKFNLDTLRFGLGELDGARGPVDVEAKVDLEGDNVGISLMTGAYYDFDLGPGLKPYIAVALESSSFRSMCVSAASNLPRTAMPCSRIIWALRRL